MDVRFVVGVLWSLLACVLAAASPTEALAQWTFTLVADEPSTGIDLGHEPPSISGHDIAFFGNANTALFALGPTGVPVALVQAGDQIPPTEDGLIFRQVSSQYSFAGNTFAFVGSSTQTPPQFGVYALNSAGLIALAGLGSTLPNSAGAFLGVDGDDVAFGGSSSIRVRRGNTVEVIADTDTPQPGTTQNLTFFTGMNFAGGTVVFSGGSTSRTGIYFDRNDGHGIVKLVDTNDTAPGSTAGARFSTFLTTANRLVIDGDDVLFYAEVADGRIGLFLARGFGPPQIIADYDPGSPSFLPGGTERADRVFNISVSNGEVAFIARDDGNDRTALFATHAGVLERVIGTGDPLGGSTVLAVDGGDEMRSGDTLVFSAQLTGQAQSAIYRADRGQPATRSSGMISNGSFANGLSSWGASGSVNVVAGPAARLTADDSIPGPTQITQSIDTPNGSYMIFFDYRFTTTAGTLDVLINGTPIAHIPAPSALNRAFTSIEALVNDPGLMGLSGAALTFRLSPGSLADALLRGIFSPQFALPNSGGEACGQTEASLPCDPSLGVHDRGCTLGTPSTGTSAASVAAGSDLASAMADAISVSGPIFSGLQFHATAVAQGRDCGGLARAFAYAQVVYGFAGSSPQPPAVDLQLRLTGSIELMGDFGATPDTTASLFLPATITTSRAKVVKRLRIVVRPDTREVREIMPPLAEKQFTNDLLAILSDPNGASTISLSAAPATGGGDASRKYDVAVQHDFGTALYGLLNEQVAWEVGKDTGVSMLRLEAPPEFNGSIVADFSRSFEGTLSTGTPGVRLVSLRVGVPPDDGDGVPESQDLCPGTPVDATVDAGGCAASQLDDDGDAFSNAADNCPLYATPDFADTDRDGRGDACECTDQNGDGRNTVADLAAISSAIFSPAQATPLCDGNNDARCSVSDIIAASIEILSPTSTSICPQQPFPGP